MVLLICLWKLFGVKFVGYISVSNHCRVMSVNVIAVSLVTGRERWMLFFLSFFLFPPSHASLKWLIKMRLLDLLTFSVSWAGTDDCSVYSTGQPLDTFISSAFVKCSNFVWENNSAACDFWLCPHCVASALLTCNYLNYGFTTCFKLFNILWEYGRVCRNIMTNILSLFIIPCSVQYKWYVYVHYRFEV